MQQVLEGELLQWRGGHLSWSALLENLCKQGTNFKLFAANRSRDQKKVEIGSLHLYDSAGPNHWAEMELRCPAPA